jgi:hypothetical protein
MNSPAPQPAGQAVLLAMARPGIEIRTGWGVRWDAGEEHTSGAQTGLIALAIEGAPLGLFEPETPAG